MSDFGISDSGFNRKRLDQLLAELNAEVKSIFGDNFNVSPESPDGQINGVVSESNANLWELAEEAYNAFNPSAATGVTLSNLVQLNGITRLPATVSRVQLTVGGTEGTTVPAGSLISTSDTGDQFRTEIDVTISAIGTAYVYASATVVGEIAAIAGTLTKIDTPITGWVTVTNDFDADIGTEEETDVELRARRARSTAIGAQAIIDAIYAGVANVPGVTQTVVLENDTNSVDANGLPPHSFQVIVVGGLDEHIAEVIWLKKPAGILSYGDESVSIDDSQGLPHLIGFSRPTEIDIYVTVSVTAFEGFPADGENLIKQAIVDYANGDLIPGRGFGLSDDVIYTRLYTPINSVVNHEIDTLTIGLAPNPAGVDNIPIVSAEVSHFTVDNIVVNVT